MSIIIKSFFEGFFLGVDSASALKYGEKASVVLKEADFVLPSYKKFQPLNVTDSLYQDALKLGKDFKQAKSKVINNG